MLDNPAINDPEVSLDQPWLGLASFTEDFRAYFYGRAAEIDELLRRVERRTLTVLFGKSGLGKTSLIQAGLFPRLRSKGFHPVYIRLDFASEAPDLTTQVRAEMASALVAAKLSVPPSSTDETLWEYFHRRDGGLCSDSCEEFTPVLAFDQFEEIFTIGIIEQNRRSKLADFIADLSDLVENRPPEALEDSLRRNPEEADRFDFAQTRYRVIISLREDYLANLEDLRTEMPSLIENRMRLTHLDGDQALEAVVRPGRGIIQPDVGRQIVRFVSGANQETGKADLSVDPALLSLVCRELNNERIKRGQAEITADLLAGSSNEILRDFYERSLSDHPSAVRAFVEEELLTESGHRENIALERAEKMLASRGASVSAIEQLVNRRLLRVEERLGVRRVELTHDVLTQTVQTSQDRRRAEEALDLERKRAERIRAEQRAQKRKQRVTVGVACLLALALIATIWGAYYAFVQDHKSHYRTFVKRFGFPVGIDPLTEAEARRLPVSLLFVQKGITRDGWKLRWKPAYRMLAVNGHLEYTTNHGIGTHLWYEGEAQDSKAGNLPLRAESLGLNRVCQWEFVADAQGNIAYERGLDRDGRMVWGLVYSPSGLASGSTRLARFVGPDGFSQLQRKSSAEYLEIQYGQGGEEARVMFRDARNLPAIGPDGAFGRKIAYDAGGHLTRLLSLDAQGTEMIDNAGNCGMSFSYSKRGLVNEARSVGPDLSPLPVRDGYSLVKYQYDALGRLERQTFYGSNGEPVLHKDGNHGWTAEYDDRGNQTAWMAIGLDGKPLAMKEGYARWKATYDQHGRMIGAKFFGPSGEPVLVRDGNHGWTAEYDEKGNQVAWVAIGLDDNRVLLANGYAGWKSTFDARGKITRTTYFGASGEPVLRNEGNHGWIAEYDERGNQISRTWLGLDEMPVSVDGIATQRSSFDARGNEIRRTFHGVSGEPVLRKDGNHGWVADYDERGNQITWTAIGPDGKPVTLANGYASWRSNYDALGNVTRTTYFGASGEPVLRKEGNHGWIAEYDERGNQISWTWLGLDEKPISFDGIATQRSSFDARGNETRRTYHGVSGEPALHKDGNHGWVAEYDERGNQITWTAIGPDGKPMALADGYASWRSTYDARGKVTRTTYFGTSGEPVLRKEGEHGWMAEYDERGNQISRTWLGLDEMPISVDGIAAQRSSFDARGNEIRRTFHGVSGEPALLEDGNHGWVAEYDERGNQITWSAIGPDGKPVALADGYASWRSTYDARGKITRTTYFGASDEPVLRKEGEHGWMAEYDERGNQISWTWLGLDEKPMSLDGIATQRSSFDARGNETRRTFHGVSGEPVLHQDGNHGWVADYDERGNQTAWTAIGPDGKPVALADGYASWRSNYDARGKVIRTAYFGASGEPVLRKKGGHGWIAEYDEHGNQVSKTWLGLDEKPLPLIVEIVKVFPGSYAEAQGVHPNDILLSYANWTLFPERDSAESWRQLVSNLDAAKEMQKRLLVWREGELLPLNFGPGEVGIEISQEQVSRDLLERIKIDFERRGLTETKRQ